MGHEDTVSQENVQRNHQQQHDHQHQCQYQHCYTHSMTPTKHIYRVNAERFGFYTLEGVYQYLLLPNATYYLLPPISKTHSVFDRLMCKIFEIHMRYLMYAGIHKVTYG